MSELVPAGGTVQAGRRTPRPWFRRRSIWTGGQGIEVAGDEARSDGSPGASRHLYVVAAIAGVFALGLVGGERLERYALNWWVCSDYMGADVRDRYELTLERPITEGEPVPADVDSRSVAAIGSLPVSWPLTPEVHLVPELLSEVPDQSVTAETDVRQVFQHAPSSHTNSWGEVNIEAEHFGVGVSLSGGFFDPARLSASFMIGNGGNGHGGLTFYELRIDHGRLWSEAVLYRYDCTADGRYGSCRGTRLHGNLDLGPVHHWYEPVGSPHPGERIRNGGTEIFAYIALPVPGSNRPSLMSRKGG